eukprot:186544-Rhodomonas_salina.1
MAATLLTPHSKIQRQCSTSPQHKQHACPTPRTWMAFQIQESHHLQQLGCRSSRLQSVLGQWPATSPPSIVPCEWAGTPHRMCHPQDPAPMSGSFVGIQHRQGVRNQAPLHRDLVR